MAEIRTTEVGQGVLGVLWDIDDTLVDHSGAERAAILEHLDAQGILDSFPSPERAADWWKDEVERTYPRYLSGELTFPEQRRLRVHDFLGRAGLSVADADAWFAGYRVRHIAHRRVFDDALPALDALSGYRHGLLSNSSVAYQHEKLAVLGLRDRFASLVCSEELGHAKPAPEAFLAGCSALGLPPDRVVYVGDRLTTDALGARAAGLHAVWLDRSGAGDGLPEAADMPRVHTLADLPELLRVIDFGAPPTIR
ncbi:HAD family hydrolase [Streptacidiphilus sp. MAP5-3]|uniref:HAD family hydrolase n=1 Tax=unclassified Streptacidiphilus TaxID=2643834 RepID=UPI0035113E6D